MALQCSSEKIARLPIDERYKKAFVQFCSMPDNQSACELICDTPDDILVNKIKEIEQTVGDWAINGPPDEIVQQAQSIDPKTTAIMAEGLERVRPEAEARMRDANSFANGGLASLGRFGDNNMVHAAKGEMVVPNNVFASNPGLREGLGALMKSEGADPRRYTVGGPKASINPYTGRQEFFSLGGLIGGVVGFAVCGPACAAIGAGGGTFIETGDVGESLLMAAGGYAIGTMAAGAGFGAGAAGAASVVDLSAAAVTPEMVSAYAAENMIGLEAAAAELGASAATASQAAALNASFLTTPPIPSATPGIAQQTMQQAASMGGQAPVQAAAKVTGTPSFEGWWRNQLGDKTLLSAEQTGLPFNITAGDAVKAAPYVASMFEKRPAADTSPWLAQDAVPAYMKDMPDIVDLDAYQKNLNSVRPLTTQGMVGYGGQQRSPMPMVPQPPQMPIPSGNKVIRPAFACGGHVEKDYVRGGQVSGPGTETSDSIPSRLSDGEFVMTASAVRGMGNGDLRKGAQRMYNLMDRLEKNNG